ncbi:MAG: RnfABCDGE type electron transport complex subunit D [Phycisphaerales bacterium]|nr:MAG: RnfABCDGE type electron transport complex subunit D [Phycisphaerales bacterium]
MLRNLTVSPAPHISKPLSTRGVMLDVIIALAPAMIAAGLYFRVHAIILIATCVISCAVTEWLCNLMRRKSNSLDDLSAVVTGIILALSLPPALPIWAAVIGGVFSIAVGKMVFGGLGANIFNPAMVGRTFLTASFGMLMTTWMVPATIDSEMPRISAENPLDARTQATPLAHSKQALKTKQGAEDVNEQLGAVFIGEVGGCLGETSALALIAGVVYLLMRRTINFHIPLAVLLSAFVFASVTYLINSEAGISPWTHLCSGGMLMCAFFIATDPVTAPLTRRGMWVFGIGVGAITMLIRVVGEYPEGVMYSVLLMNAVTPLIDRFYKRIPTGGKASG